MDDFRFRIARWIISYRAHVVCVFLVITIGYTLQKWYLINNKNNEKRF